MQAKSVEDKTKAIEVAVSRVRATLTWLQQHQFLLPRDMIRYENVVSLDLLPIASKTDMAQPTQIDLLSSVMHEFDQGLCALTSHSSLACIPPKVAAVLHS